MIDVEFTGTESPAEVVTAAIDVFSQQPPSPHVTIFRENGIPKMLYAYQGGDVEFSCTYRLDTMLLPFYGEAERVFDEIAELGILDIDLREPLVRYIAFGGMVNLLSRLLSLQLEIFKDTFAEMRVTSRGLFWQTVLKTRATTKDKALLTRAVSNPVKRWVNQVIDEAMKKKRDFLVGFMNSQPLMHIPTSAGRPLGSTKPEKKKAQDKAEFESKIEQTVRSLFHTLNREPFKYEVAEALGIGGVNPKGTDSRINSFNNKLARLGIDYAAIIKRLNLHG